MTPMWLYGECVARWMAALCAEREVWKMMSPSRSGVAACAARHATADQQRQATSRASQMRRASRTASMIRSLPIPRLSRHALPTLLYVRRRTSSSAAPQFRGAHLKHARASVARGELVLGGAFADPVDGAVLLFSAPSKTVVETFASDDPYVTGGLVTDWKVREWTTVIGEDAAHPLPPGL